MQEVNISELKARLSHYVRLAENGEEVVVKDRERPVARLTGVTHPVRRFQTIPPRLTRKEAERILAKLPKPDLSKITPEVIEDTIRWLREDRDRR
jgi:prevent-host-death family protein